MQFFVTKTGLETFDVARAWGLAVLLNVSAEEEIELQDVGWAIVVKVSGHFAEDISQKESWVELFSAPDVQWEKVFTTAEDKRKEAREILQEKYEAVLRHYRDPSNTVELGTKNKRKGQQTIYGSLDPAAFKGLRSDSKASYKEPPLSAPSEHAALAYLGMATCGTYWELSNGKTCALLLVPSLARLSQFRSIRVMIEPIIAQQRRRKSRPRRAAAYYSSQNAAAHYAVQLAKKLQERIVSPGSLQDRFSAVIYFTLFGAGQQTKPSQGSQLNLAPLMQLIQEDPHGSEAVLNWLDYCFRLGATDGAEDLALAATELVMRWDLDAFERLVKVLVRILGQEQVQRKSPRDFREILWITNGEAIKKAMEVISHVQTGATI